MSDDITAPVQNPAEPPDPKPTHRRAFVVAYYDCGDVSDPQTETACSPQQAAALYALGQHTGAMGMDGMADYMVLDVESRKVSIVPVRISISWGEPW